MQMMKWKTRIVNKASGSGEVEDAKLNICTYIQNDGTKQEIGGNLVVKLPPRFNEERMRKSL